MLGCASDVQKKIQKVPEKTLRVQRQKGKKDWHEHISTEWFQEPTFCGRDQMMVTEKWGCDSCLSEIGRDATSKCARSTSLGWDRSLAYDDRLLPPQQLNWRRTETLRMAWPHRLLLESQRRRRRQVVEICLHDERPRFDRLLEDIQEGQSPALFCCVPSSLAKSLNDVVANSKCSCLPVTLYQETLVFPIQFRLLLRVSIWCYNRYFFVLP